MKCDNCQKVEIEEHIPHCTCGHWEGNDGVIRNYDPWEDCLDYKPREKEGGPVLSKYESRKKIILEKCGLDWDHLTSLSNDIAYDYLINTYIPDQGEADMKAFIQLGFNHTAYLIWKFCGLGVFNDNFEREIKKQILEEYHVWPTKGLEQ